MPIFIHVKSQLWINLFYLHQRTPAHWPFSSKYSRTKNKPSSEYYNISRLAYVFCICTWNKESNWQKLYFFFQSFTLPLSKINLVQNSAFRSLYNHMDLIPSFFQLNVQSLQLVVLPKPHQKIVWHHRTDLANRGKTWVGDTEKKMYGSPFFFILFLYQTK